MEDEDEDLKRAIALSMADGEAQSSAPREPILIEDSDDEDLKQAIALSLQGYNADKPSTEASNSVAMQASQSVNMSHNATTGHASSCTQPNATGLAGLDRIAMEQERLARVSARTCKRQREISPPALSRPSKVTRTLGTRDIGNVAICEAQTGSDQATRSAATIADGIGKTAAEVATTAAATTTAESMSLPVSDGRISYPDGRLFKTWAFRQARTGTEIKIEEVLERRTLKTALLSSFQVDFEWLFTKLDTQRTNFQFVLSEKDATRRAALKADLESLGPNVKACFPPLEGNANCMHSKLMLLFHPDKLRVAVPSANLVPYDWGEGGIMENTAWLIDLPRLEEGIDHEETPFLDELRYFLTKQGLSDTVLRSLDRFEWKGTSKYAFVHSITGPSYGKSMPRTGLMGLSTAVKRLCLTASDAHVDMAASSIGALNSKQLSLLSAASRGSLSVTSSADGTVTSLPPVPDFDPSRFRLYYPTHDYVKTSEGGIPSGGTIWLKRAHYTRPTFPTTVFRQYISTRKGLLSHCKLIFVRGTNVQGPVAYLYAGSANASESAWGTIVSDNKPGPKRGQVRITCRNWEAGVLIPVLGGPSSVSADGAVSKSGAAAATDDVKDVVSDGVEDKAPDAGNEAGLDREIEEEEETASNASTATDDNEDGNQPIEQAPQTSQTAQPAQRAHTAQVPDWEVFKPTIDGPFKVPSDPIGDNEPWYCEESVYGRGRMAMGGDEEEE
ncbi:hypothetical protein ANO11243_096820 [Dothideomycetidae sp. 11243]|nr:hypothetical protein ANO11243_096820 [fungal sp. No.11243]